jgi:uncharacterized protein (TIGR03089 family)
MGPTVLTLLADALARDPGRPLVTFYDGATGERVELSVRTFDNWVSKVANLLADDLMFEPGDSIAFDLPPHWQSMTLVVGAWTAGLRVVDGSATLTVVGPTAVAAGNAMSPPVLALSLRPMGGPFVEPLPAGWLDFAREAPPQPDALLVDLAISGETVAVTASDIDQTHSEIIQVGTYLADHLGMSSGGRLITDANPGQPDGLVPSVVVPLVTGGSVVLVVNASADDVASIEDQEGVTAQHWVG